MDKYLIFEFLCNNKIDVNILIDHLPVHMFPNYDMTTCTCAYVRAAYSLVFIQFRTVVESRCVFDFSNTQHA